MTVSKGFCILKKSFDQSIILNGRRQKVCVFVFLRFREIVRKFFAIFHVVLVNCFVTGLLCMGIVMARKTCL